jgi:predicted RNA-binding protein with PIN domain
MPYLIDGNNLLGSWGAQRPPGDARAEVVRRVAAFCRSKGARATVVFDGAPFRPEFGAQDLGPVALRFPPEGQDADTVIKDIIDKAARPGELLLVSSDKALYSYARTRGVSTLRAHEWNALLRGARPRGAKARSLASSAEKPEREVDVDGWLQRFSRR